MLEQDYATNYESLRDEVIRSLGVPFSSLSGQAMAVLNGAFLYAQRQAEVWQRWLKRWSAGTFLARRLDAQSRRRLIALMRAGSGRTARLRKKRAKALAQARLLLIGEGR